jgi:hypothetical protein
VSEYRDIADSTLRCAEIAGRLLYSDPGYAADQLYDLAYAAHGLMVLAVAAGEGIDGAPWPVFRGELLDYLKGEGDDSQ